MKPKHSFQLSPGWEIDMETVAFLSPPIDSENPSQVVLFDEDQVKDGSISASITGLGGESCSLGYEFNEGSIMFRYDDPEHFYVLAWEDLPSSSSLRWRMDLAPGNRSA
jgi:hypothetical protein